VDNKDTHYIYSTYIAEARRAPEQRVEGLNDFIAQIDDAKGAKVSYDLLMDLMDIIDKSGCPKIAFEELTGALGISKTDACIVSDTVIGLALPRMLYIILHEVAHQFQYTKHGEDFAQNIYFGTNTPVESGKELLKIENTADRYAIRMTRYLLVKHDIPYSKFDLIGAYSNYTPAGISHYINNLRNQIKNLKLKNITEVNALIYNMVRKKIQPSAYSVVNDIDHSKIDTKQPDLGLN